jgi:hypothetical protein
VREPAIKRQEVKAIAALVSFMSVLKAAAGNSGYGDHRQVELRYIPPKGRNWQAKRISVHNETYTGELCGPPSGYRNKNAF